jgi:hypothetical protein
MGTHQPDDLTPAEARRIADEIDGGTEAQGAEESLSQIVARVEAREADAEDES